MFNTTIPATKQILGYANYTDNQLRAVLEFEFDPDLPCPIDVRMAIIDITRLRYQIATTSFIPALMTTRHGILEKLDTADIDDWAEKNSPLGGATIQTVGQIFHTAAWLYGILTLPRSVTHSWARAHLPLQPCEADLDPYQDLRSHQRSRLLTLLKEVFPLLQYPNSVRWPLLVAGVALGADGAQVDRAFVDQCLFTIWQNPLGDGAIFICLQKLRDFWHSGKAGWEDCFDEPVPG